MVVQSVDARRWLARLRDLSEEMTPDYADYAPTPVQDFLDPDDPTLFPRLTPAQVEYLGEIGTQLSFARGEEVFEHGNRETPLYVVLSGALDIIERRPEGDRYFTQCREGEVHAPCAEGPPGLAHDLDVLLRHRLLPQHGGFEGLCAVG
jgi:hypothetical protein